ncbi:hypothetical protein H072_8450 [Dactylellina haptotyla CBS 200.50]|uniref:DUF8032 domain-containing protein n=1 Tax=Dactylellina haptotyla (strain CBS 200.50) TaxID=1284197 RepID=S8BRV7_DACHA|nr:hypothetical protein H072_8450 [Dactylellina haptotyla CBS 200.50]
MYHTPQSNSPTSVASPGAADHRSVYSAQHIPQQLYAYPQTYSLPPSQQSPYPSAQHMTSQPLLMSQPGATAMTHHPGIPQHQSPTTKFSQAPVHRPQQQQQQQQHNAGLQQPPVNHNNPINNNHAGAAGNSVNPSAAPGPIPATTPLVVRQDNNGVQWIAFEYSRDRIKMEYTIRCDVESVNVDSLSQEFKQENCVYPRACCPKDQYRGNRLVYETECNTVGWALAELNPPLRGKRGLIQRAVDSWRNSNQDPRLRSRRVRRMAKLNNRKAVHAASQQLNAGSPVHAGQMPLGVKTQGGMGQPGQGMHDGSPIAGNGDMNGMLRPQHYQANSPYVGVHPHAHMGAAGPNSRTPSGHMSPATAGDYTNGHHHPHQGTPNSADSMHARHVYQPYPPAYPSEPTNGASMPPSMHDVMDGNLGNPQMGPTATSQSTTVSTSAPAAALQNPTTSEQTLFADIPEHKRRKFILVDDPHRGSRVRVRVMLDNVDMDEIPDSYRKSNSVYPRSYYARQMPIPEESSGTVVGDSIQIQMMDGSNLDVSTPPPTKIRKDKEIALNDLGYRMSWSQSRVFAGRTMFLQRALDAYRNKMRCALIANGQDATAVAPHLETRVGKRKWLERNRRSKASSTRD